MDRKAHWEVVFKTKPSEQASWFQPTLSLSLDLIESAGLGFDSPIIDVGGGTSTLVDRLLDLGYQNLGVLDLSANALAEVKIRLGSRSGEVEWFEEDVTTFESPHKWALWHDRALFHFLIDLPARIAYKQSLLDAVEDEGHAIIATFGPEGPTTCSGLDVKRYSGADLDAFFGPELCLLEEALEDHKTPLGATQQFVYCRFQRV